MFVVKWLGQEEVLCVMPESPVPEPGELNWEELEPLSGAERLIIQYVASMAGVLPKLPRLCTLTFLARDLGIGKRRIYSALRKFELLGVLSVNPNEAIQRATALLPRAMAVSKF